MKIPPQEVARVARLARLEVAEDRLDQFAAQLGDILSYMDKLGEVDTTGVAPMYTPVAHTTVLRPDEVRREYARSEVLGNSPEPDEEFFVVPRIV